MQTSTNQSWDIIKQTVNDVELNVNRNIYREALEKILTDPVRVVTIDTPMEFIHIDKNKKGEWVLAITKNLVVQNESRS